MNLRAFAYCPFVMNKQKAQDRKRQTETEGDRQQSEGEKDTCKAGWKVDT